MNAFAPKPERMRPSTHLVRSAYVSMLVGRAGGSVADLARSRYGQDAATLMLLRAPVAPATVGDAAWAGALVQRAALDFLATLPQSAGAPLIATGLRATLAGAATALIPSRQNPATAAMTWVPEAGPIPVNTTSLEAIELGPLKKLAAIVAMTSELAMSASGEAVFRALLEEDTALSLDLSLFSDEAADATRPAGLLAGVAPMDATPGGGEAAMLGDLEGLAAQVFARGGRSVAFVLNVAQATTAALRLRNADRVTVWPSAGMPPGRVVALDPGAFVGAVDPTPEFDTSESALLVMDTTPGPVSAPGAPNVVAAPLRSLWQTDSMGLRMILRATWAMRSPALAWVEAATW